MNASEWFERDYQQNPDKQRRYPNEEFVRFLGRNFFHVPQSERSVLSILEVGCGIGSNLKVVVEEGFSAVGLDTSSTALNICDHNLEFQAELFEQSMLELPNRKFDAICDVFSSYCLSSEEFHVFLERAYAALKPGGVLFLYTPCDLSTYSFNAPYPFRLDNRGTLESNLVNLGFTLIYSEAVLKTYNNQTEQFVWLVMEAVKA